MSRIKIYYCRFTLVHIWVVTNPISRFCPSHPELVQSVVIQAILDYTGCELVLMATPGVPVWYCALPKLTAASRSSRCCRCWRAGSVVSTAENRLQKPETTIVKAVLTPRSPPSLSVSTSCVHQSMPLTTIHCTTTIYDNSICISGSNLLLN